MKPLSILCRDLAAAKEHEAAATKTRRAIEADIVTAMDGTLPEEGSAKADTDFFRVTVTQSIRRTVDADKLASMADCIPEAVGKRLFTWKPSVVLRELRYIQSNEPAIYQAVAQCITAKPGKPAVKLERIEQQEAA